MTQAKFFRLADITVAVTGHHFGDLKPIVKALNGTGDNAEQLLRRQGYQLYRAYSSLDLDTPIERHQFYVLNLPIARNTEGEPIIRTFGIFRNSGSIEVNPTLAQFRDMVGLKGKGWESVLLKMMMHRITVIEGLELIDASKISLSV